MVNSSFNNLISILNFGISTSKRTVFVPNSSFNIKILDLLRTAGYILSYSVNLGDNKISVYYNFSCSKTRLFLPAKNNRKHLSYDKLRAFSNSGRVFILSTNCGYMFSDFALLNKIGGSIVLELRFLI